MIKVKIQGKAFVISQAVLTKNSKHFTKVVGGSAVPSLKRKTVTQTIEMDDVGPNAFQLYFDVINQLSADPDYELPLKRAAGPSNNTKSKAKNTTGNTSTSTTSTSTSTSTSGRWRAEQLLRLWQLGFRFGTPPVCGVANRALAQLFARFTPDAWRRVASGGRFSMRGFRVLFGEMAVAWRMCRRPNDNNRTMPPLPFADRCVAALAAAPPRVFSNCVGELAGEPEFRVEVATAFSKRMAEEKEKKERMDRWLPLPGRK